MITRSGVAVLVGAVVLVVAGRVLGLVEGYVLATAAFAVLAAAIVMVILRPSDLDVRREVRPDRVHVGHPARIEIEVSRPRRASSVVTLVDPIADRDGARLKIATPRSGEPVRAAYRLPTRNRGEVAVGPMTIESTDPFGLVRRTRPGEQRVSLIVLPHMDPVEPLPALAGSAPHGGHDIRPSPTHRGDELHGVRSYVPGDDIRRVHWPMSAHLGELVIRQDEEPRQGRLLIALDTSAAHCDEETFERMVSAAASVAAAHRHQGDMVRLLVGSSTDTGWVNGQLAFESLLEVLALTGRADDSLLHPAIGRIDGVARSVVVVAGDRPAADLAAPGSGSRGGPTTLVRFRSSDTRVPAAQSDPATESDPLDRTSVPVSDEPSSTQFRGRLIDVAPSDPFPETWARAIRPPVAARG